MYQAYPGQIKDGRPVFSEDVTLPEDANIIITVLNEPTSAKIKNGRQNDALKRFFSAIDAIEDEPITDEDLAYFERNRINLSRACDVL